MMNRILAVSPAGSPWPVRCCLGVYVACFTVGGLNHAHDFATHGWRPYQWGVPVLEVFWTTLIVQDFAIVALLLTGRRRAGLLVSAVVMVLDVAANSYALLGLGQPGFAPNLILQTLFCGFVLGSIAFLWPRRPA